MTITGILTAIVIGLIIGALGRLVLPGKQRIPIWLTILVGIVAAFVGTALARAERAEKIVRSGIGDDGAAEVLAETAGWLARFDRASVVELDYGGLVTFLDDDALRNDTSAELVQDALQALQDGDAEVAQSCYEDLRDFWGAVVARRGNG